jgi:hypothetical protein
LEVLGIKGASWIPWDSPEELTDPLLNHPSSSQSWALEQIQVLPVTKRHEKHPFHAMVDHEVHQGLDGRHKLGELWFIRHGEIGPDHIFLTEALLAVLKDAIKSYRFLDAIVEVLPHTEAGGGLISCFLDA